MIYKAGHETNVEVAYEPAAQSSRPKARKPRHRRWVGLACSGEYLTTLEVLALLVLPVAAARWSGLLLRSLMDEHGDLWSLWLVLLAASTTLWVYLLVELVP